MRKIATMLVLIVSFGFLFAGAVSAQDIANVTVTVADENGDPVTTAFPDDKVTADVVVLANDQEIQDPLVKITVDPQTGLKFDPEKTTMQLNGGQVITNDISNYPYTAFFYFDDTAQNWVWDIAFAIQDNMHPGDIAELMAPATVTGTGEITTTAELDQFGEDGYSYLNSADYMFLSVPRATGNTETEIEPIQGTKIKATVPMQETGTPLGLAALGLLSIIGGTLYSRRR